LSFGGMLSDVAHRTTKNGRPFGMFQIEDYEHGEKIFLFGDDYIKFKNYLSDGWFLFIQGRVQSKKFNEHELEFKIHTIELLADVREKKARRITLQIDLSMLSDDIVESLVNLCEANPGTCGMTLQIKDLGVGISMPSRTTRIALSNEFLNGVEDLKVFDYLIHTK
ncbi:MAG: hypothetical protein NWS86_00700, partial [Flavobacteriales bacterium]|nr:hypothetical protein [Flavobacteriales bacterium]